MVLMEEVKPSPARQKPRLKQRVNVLEESMKKLEERVQALEDCKGKYTNNWSKQKFVINFW